MSEGLSQNSVPGGKNRLIEARASFDAMEYVNLMGRVSPDDLIIDDEGKIILNLSSEFGFDEVMKETKRKLNLGPDEMAIYLITLEDKIKKLIRQ